MKIDYLSTKELGKSSAPEELERAIKQIEKEMNTISIKSERGGNQLIELIEEKIRLQGLLFYLINQYGK